MEDKKASSAEAHELPHYALPNFATVLPTYSNHESDVIAQAFRIGNYVSLNDLPDRIKPGQVSRSRFQKILDNRQQDEGHEPMPRAKPKYFSEFEYIPSPYSIADSLAREERQNEAALLEKAGHKQPFRMADQAVKLQYEDGFGGDFAAYANGPDPFERADDQALRHKWLQEAQILAGPFRPSGRVKGQMGEAATERPSPARLGEMVETIREAINADWAEYNFIVCATDDEHIVVRFEMDALDSAPGLVAYMNLFARTSHVVSKFMLKKVIEDWNVTPDDGHLYFTFRPPWISVRVSDAFFSLHPEQRSYADPRLGSTKSLAAAAESTSQADADAELAAASSLRPELT